jgi:hypothetical protein
MFVTEVTSPELVLKSPDPGSAIVLLESCSHLIRLEPLPSPEAAGVAPISKITSDEFFEYSFSSTKFKASSPCSKSPGTGTSLGVELFLIIIVLDT